jgi:hypothetical protein
VNEKSGSRPSTRVDKVVSWIGWHIGELVGVIVPGVVALRVTPWAAVVSGVVGAGWAVHEIRLVRQQAEVYAGTDVRALETGKSEEDVSADEAPDPAAGRGGAR